MKNRFLLLVVFVALIIVPSSRVGGRGLGDQWKPYAQLKSDLRKITKAGYSKVCLFDLKSIRDYPDSRYVPLLKKYADKGMEITVYVQDVEPSQETLDLVESMGVSSVILYERDLLTLFKEEGIETYWWSGTAFPPNHTARLQYMDWPDLRSEKVREDIANWVVQIPEVDGGLSLDYIRWNQVGDGRNAEQVTDLLRRIRTNWDMNGNGTLSAAVFPYLGRFPDDGGALSVGQKWDEWLEAGLVDFVYPMAYQSEDIPYYIGEWEEAYDRRKIIPCLSIMDYSN